ncbi:cuticle protein AM1159-like isoform X2 [Macrobrachium nipponense]|uniref:cuticle protein AM1159-like isoform X2 n=1 Tax=Macrobrachium nipponense TaxID=159736 RepID=UPI0030C85340
MKCVLLSVLAAVALAAPQGYEAPAALSSHARSVDAPVIAIVRDERVSGDDGSYNVDVETANGIVYSESGSPGVAGAVASSGRLSYTAPDGTPVELTFVANENGFQPQGNHLPVAPEFPHPIPQFVLDQIAFAEEQRARGIIEGAPRESSVAAPSRSYASPQ